MILLTQEVDSLLQLRDVKKVPLDLRGRRFICIIFSAQRRKGLVSHYGPSRSQEINLLFQVQNCDWPP